MNRYITIALAAVAVVALALPVAAQSSNTLEGEGATDTVVLAGADRYDTAAQIALSVFGDMNDTRVLYIASGESPVDALAASVTNEGSQVMLLVKRDEVPEPTRDALQKIDHGKLVFLGGDEVISPAVRDEVESLTCNYATQDC